MHVTSRDPTLNAVGTRSCAIRRGMSKKRATAIFDLSLRVGPRPIRNWVSVTTPLCLRNGARETREKTRKGMRGVGREIHVTSRDPTLNAVGTRSCAIRRGMSKKRATAISLFDQPYFLDPLHFDCCDFEEMVPGVGHFLHRRDCLRALCGLL